MIAVDTSAILAIALGEPEEERFKDVMRHNDLVIGWPTLFETRIVLTAKGFSKAEIIVARLCEAPNVTPVAFDGKHYQSAQAAYEIFGKGRHPAALNMGDCFAYAVAAISKAPLLFKGNDFSKTDLKCHPASPGTDPA
ncbi:type II toxin-antitoxin system VapC family toxin [Labrenzia sp. 011]|uniref:type II toxin-antitoxin system VapC family toxin n=1 Tax=Labrenzia sp. 011 TaxID=2171494 RepID=UPI000D515960|nr:type II toxin-antitoxin system VapC family toxin [Labrenzia sp. 011]PVB60431.1 PIN domain nuclease [Labrenzia sp. 011]